MNKPITYKPKQSEHQLQSGCVQWFRLQYPKLGRLLFSIPNGARLHGTGRQRAMQWAKLEREGAVAGAADLFLAVPSGDFAGLFIEMKTERGRQSERQKEFEKNIVEMGYGYVMPRSFSEFQAVVQSYMACGRY